MFVLRTKARGSGPFVCAASPRLWNALRTRLSNGKSDCPRGATRPSVPAWPRVRNL